MFDKTRGSRILGILLLGGVFCLCMVVATAYIVGNRSTNILVGGQSLTIEGNATLYIVKSEGEIIVLDKKQNVVFERLELKKDGEFYYLEIEGVLNVIQNGPITSNLQRAVIEKTGNKLFRIYFSVDGTYKITVY